MKKALLFGATGFVGSYLLDALLNSPDYDQVTIVVRKDPGITHLKLQTLIGNLDTLPSLKEKLVADDVFIALGTTKKNTPDPKEYYRIDHDYPVTAARIAKENGATSVFVVSAVGRMRIRAFFISAPKARWSAIFWRWIMRTRTCSARR